MFCLVGSFRWAFNLWLGLVTWSKPLSVIGTPNLGAGSLMEIKVDQFGSTLMSWRAELFSSDRPSRIRSFVGAIPSNVMTQVTCSMISWKKSYLRVFGLGNFLNFLECSRLIRRKRRPRFRKRQVFESLFDLKRSKAVCNLVESTVISKHYTDRLGYSQISCRRLYM